MIAHLLTRRALLGGAVFAAFGMWQAAARLPAGLGLGTHAVSCFWMVAVFAAAGLLIAPALAGFSLAASRGLVKNRPAPAAATVETLCWLPILLWLLLNEVVYSTTAEVLSYDAIRMTWHNPAATFENAWEMGWQYLTGVAAAITALCALIGWLSYRSFSSMGSARVDPRQPGVHAAKRVPALRLTVPLACGLAGTVMLLAWQIGTGPGAALAAVLRASPPLKALNLTRALLGQEMRLSDAEPAGPPIISDQSYADGMSALAENAPNIILIVLESVPARALHCYGHPRVDVSPNMDSLASAGVRFDHCWSTASFSSYGLISIMTSLHLLRDEVNDHLSDHDFPQMSIPRALKLAGYETGMFSSGDEAFDHINAFCRPTDFDRYYTHDTSGIVHPDCMRMDDRYAVEQFEAWMRKRGARLAAGSPFAPAGGRRKPLYASFYLQATHFDYGVPDPWSRYYQPTPPLMGNGNGIIRIPPDVLPLLRNQYDNAMRYSDYWVGRIVETLKAADAFDNCVIAIIGDHGEAFMEHGLARHGVHLWEEMIHVPLIFYVGPQVHSTLGRELPGVVSDTVSSLDVAPTLAGLAGIPAHPSWQGVNILTSTYTGRDRPIYSVLQLTRWQEAVTVNKFKYIYDLSDVERYLFDLAADPGEMDNLLAAQPALANAMHHLLRIWHTHQLSYYSPSRRPFKRYIGLPEFSANHLDLLRRSVPTGAALE